MEREMRMMENVNASSRRFFFHYLNASFFVEGTYEWNRLKFFPHAHLNKKKCQFKPLPKKRALLFVVLGMLKIIRWVLPKTGKKLYGFMKYSPQRHCTISRFPYVAAQWIGVFLLTGLSWRLTLTPAAISWHTRPTLTNNKTNPSCNNWPLSHHIKATFSIGNLVWGTHYLINAYL